MLFLRREALGMAPLRNGGPSEWRTLGMAVPRNGGPSEWRADTLFADNIMRNLKMFSKLGPCFGYSFFPDEQFLNDQVPFLWIFYLQQYC